MFLTPAIHTVDRGAYLVQGSDTARCATRPLTVGGSSESDAFEGGMIPNQNWYAPSLTSNREAGLGNWDIKDIADLLQAGASHRATVYGPMAEVVYNSLQYLSDEDIQAMAVYLKALPQRDSEPPPTSQARLVNPAVMELGRKVYAKQCAMCHGDEGKGQTPAYPPLPQPVHHDVLARERPSHVAHEATPRTGRTPAAWLRLFAHPERRRGVGSGDFIPRRMGTALRPCPRRKPTSCASCSLSEERRWRPLSTLKTPSA